MKTSTILISLLFINSSVLAGSVFTSFISSLNPYLVGGTEVLLGISYYAHTVLRDVRNCFDVKIDL